MKLRIAIAAVVALAGFSSAQANTYNIGVLNSSGYQSSKLAVPNGSFSDSFYFGLPSFADLTADVTVNIDNKNFRITGISLSGDFGTTSLPLGKTFSATSLKAGNYTLLVNGTSAGHKGGKYKLELDYVIAAIPEPETYGMMLGGLGLLGIMMRRRKDETG